ncbi:MAG: hypothetical protein LBQ60_02640 [Bacteroidales bacterium]|jgi:hypothetical protein|nr:hypothetical protein [Bacteroidales bacterium]
MPNRKSWVICSLLAIACFLIYYPIFSHTFLRGWDDGWMVLNRYTEHGFTVENIKAIFTQSHGGQYAPFNQLLYTTIRMLFGYNPSVYHLSNLLWHIANACIVFLLIKNTLVYSRRAETTTAHYVALFASLLFAVHPLQVESVAWISASKTLLYSFFTLLALLAYIRYVHTLKAIWYVVSFILFLFSCGCKEQAVVFPVCLFLFDWIMHRDLKKVEYWLEKIPFFLLALIIGLYTLSLQNPEYVEKWAGYSFWQRIIFASYAIVEYLTKLVVPVKLMYLYPFPVAPGGDIPIRFFIYPVIILLLGVCLYVYRKQWPLIAGVLFFGINIFLTVHIVPMSRYAIVADRYVYLSSVGIFFIMAWYVWHYVRTLTKKYKIWCGIAVFFYLVYLGGYAHVRTKVWYNDDTLKQELRDLLEQRNRMENIPTSGETSGSES